MKVGELYTITKNWPYTGGFWANPGPIVYIGEQPIERYDGVTVINHVVFVKGIRRVIDRTFLKFLTPLTPS